LQLDPEGRTQLPWTLDKNGKAKTVDQLQQEQQERLKADLDKLASGETAVYHFANILYGENWPEELSKYKRRKEQEEHVLTVSLLFMSIGGAIFGWCLLLWTAQVLIKVLSYLNKFIFDFFKTLKKAKHRQAAISNTEEQRKNSGQESGQQQIRRKKLSKVLVNSGWYDFETNSADQYQQAQQQVGLSVKRDPHAAVLCSDERTNKYQKSLKKTAKEAIRNLPDSNENFQKLEGTLKEQTENLERQIAEFKQMAQIVVKQNSLGHSEPLNKTLSDLSQQITNIREYASQQQDRVEKLQNGYDWNIIRNFCLRIIRCVDNLENRLNRMSEQGVETAELEEVRDELVFALESSGLERYEPEINSDYRGQEKDVEVVKGKESSKDPNLKGKIAKVIRAGYRYFIDEENVKVVRTAQVKLFK
jgi:molecular chaperone GrpE (heat shock protein)